MKYFDKLEVDAAWKWLREEAEVGKAAGESDRTSEMPEEPEKWPPYHWSGF